MLQQRLEGQEGAGQAKRHLESSLESTGSIKVLGRGAFVLGNEHRLQGHRCTGGLVDYEKESAFCLCLMGRPRPQVAEGEADGTKASDTHRVLGGGTRRHREEELPPQCVGGRWEPWP